jgi:hypothetical protein
MQKWEYEWATESLMTSGIQAFLNTMGDQGWELVSVVKNEAGIMVYFFKRPKP